MAIKILNKIKSLPVIGFLIKHRPHLPKPKKHQPEQQPPLDYDPKDPDAVRKKMDEMPPSKVSYPGDSSTGSTSPTTTPSGSLLSSGTGGRKPGPGPKGSKVQPASIPAPSPQRKGFRASFTPNLATVTLEPSSTFISISWVPASKKVWPPLPKQSTPSPQPHYTKGETCDFLGSIDLSGDDIFLQTPANRATAGNKPRTQQKEKASVSFKKEENPEEEIVPKKKCFAEKVGEKKKPLPSDSRNKDLIVRPPFHW